MAKFRKKPVVIEAVLWTGRNIAEILPLSSRNGTDIVERFDGPLAIETLEGTHRADIGDWIIKGIKGELYPCKPDIFEATYERVDD